MKYPCPECNNGVPSQTVCRKCGGSGVLDDRAPPNANLHNREFAKALARNYADLLARQEPLGKEFEDVIEAHCDELYLESGRD